MDKDLQTLQFDIDLAELAAVQQILGATDKEFRQAYHRALSRTAVTLNKLGRQLVRDELKARSIKSIRARLQKFRLKKSGNALDELRLWFGLNDLPISRLKGKVNRIGSKRTPKGAMFTPSSSKLSSQSYPNAFVAKLGNGRSIYSRLGKSRFPIKEESIPIKNALQVEIEDQIFAQVPEIFLRHFSLDLKGRVASR